MISRIREKHANEEGSVTVLSIGVMVLCLLLIFLSSVVYSSLQIRSRIQTIADAAALTGANAYDLEDIEIINGAPSLELADAKVRQAITDYLNKIQIPEELNLYSIEVRAPATVAVTLKGIWHPPFVGLLFPDGIPIQETATARTYFR